MVEIGEGEIIFGSPKLDVTLLADIDQLAVVEVRAAPGWGGTALHVHARHAEAVFVIEGKVDLRLEDRVHRIDPEIWAFVPPELVHTFEVTGDEQARFLVVEEVALAHGLDDERVLARCCGGAGTGGCEFAELRRLGRVGQVRRDRRLLGAQLLGEDVEGGRGIGRLKTRRQFPPSQVEKCRLAIAWFFCPVIEDKGTTT